MRTKLLYLIALLLVVWPATVSAQQWKLTWSDEFDGTKGAPVDSTKWLHETGGSGFGNKELEFYTDNIENSHLDGIGSLIIQALADPGMERKCWYGPCLYTSARLNTRKSFSQRYGRFEVRMKIPEGQGVWPAFWLLGNDVRSVGWPLCGEIDVMENIGKEPSTVHGTIHGPGYSGKNSIGALFQLEAGHKLADDFHVYAVEWEPNKISWYLDNKLYETRTPADLPKGTKWVYDHPFFIILNLAIGGAWPGSPTPATRFPSTLEIDYVRVYDEIKANH